MVPSSSVRWVEASLSRGESITLDHHGQSMRPALEPGDRLTVSPLAGPPSIGSVLLARVGPRLVAHRLIARCHVDGDERLILRGDANAEDDPPRSATELLGEVTDIARAPASAYVATRRRLARWWRAR